ncbi:MAG: hypothetical protein ACRCX2_22665 [Paraclostridium sp.]
MWKIETFIKVSNEIASDTFDSRNNFEEAIEDYRYRVEKDFERISKSLKDENSRISYEVGKDTVKYLKSLSFLLVYIDQVLNDEI